MEKRLQGNPVSEGIACAKAYVYARGELVKAPEYFQEGQEAEKYGEFQKACEQAEQELKELSDRMSAEDADKAKIFDAHRELLSDEEILEEIREAIRGERMTPDSAVSKVYTEFAELLAGVEDPLIAERAADLKDVRDRLLRILSGQEGCDLSAFSEDVILIAGDLSPSDTATMDRTHVKGILTESGGANSHSAILARSYGIPAILGIPEVTVKIRTGTQVAMDALTGEVFVDPGEERQTAILEKIREFSVKKKAEQTFLNRPAITKDGTEIKIGINIGSPKFDAPTGQYDFIGLFRTEFLYMEGTELPDEDKQFDAYRQAVQRAEGRPVTLRTLDIGGDKTLPYMELPKEENPFLGKRAVRLCFSEKELFLAQLRAALRASAYGPLQIMFPMIGSMEDIRRAKSCLEEAKRQLREKNQAYDEKIRVGIMIEIPAIALMADLAAEEVDFASIGSNDLTQYVCAADRMNPEVAEYYRSDSPAMLRLLKFVFEEFTKRKKEISVCGEMAGNPETARLLVGLGARKLSMSSGNIAGIKAMLSGVSVSEAAEAAAKISFPS